MIIHKLNIQEEKQEVPFKKGVINNEEDGNMNGKLLGLISSYKLREGHEF